MRPHNVPEATHPVTAKDVPQPAMPRLDRADAAVLCALCLGIGVALFAPQLRSVYPFTYDELVYLRKVRAYDEWLRQGLVHARQGHPGWVFSHHAVAQAEALEDMHPGFAKFIALLPHWLMKAAVHKEGGGRMAGGIFLALACGAVYGFLRPRTGRWWAAVGAVGLASLPRVFGDAHFLALDVPIMAMVFVAALAFRRACFTDCWWAHCGAGAVVGLALGTKLNAIALLPHLVIWMAWVRPRRWLRASAGLLVAPAAFYATWPWLWLGLAQQLVRYLEFHGHHFRVGVSYLGHVYGGATTAPASYAPVMLALTLPVTWLVALAGACVLTLRRRLGSDAGFLALGLGMNLGLMMLPGVARYGGVRLFLPAMPFAVCLAVLAARNAAGRWGRGAPERQRRRISALAGLVLLAPGVVGCLRTYPYCLSYYTEPLGTAGAARLGMDVTYWGDAFAGAREFMSRPEHAQERFYVSNELATGILDAHLSAGEIPPQHRMLGRFVRGPIPADADWVIVDNHPPLWPPAVAEMVLTRQPVFTVNCCGTPILWIFAGPRQQRATG